MTESELDTVTRSLPHALGMEKSVLSSMLQYPQEFLALALEMNLTDHHFYLPAHSTLFGNLTADFAAGREIELVSLIQRLLDRGLLDRVGGPANLADLYTYAPSPGQFRAHVASLMDKFAGREMIRVANETIMAVYDQPDDNAATLECLERAVMQIRDIDATGRPQTVREAAAIVLEKLEQAIKHDPKARGILTGFDELDQMTNGMHSGEMTVIGARPSVGKTAFMMNIAEHVCIVSEIPALVFSAEMTTEGLVKRLIFSRARYNASEISRGVNPNHGDLLRIQRAALDASSAKLHIDDKSGPTINYIAAKCRRMKRDHGIGLVCIDYLGLIKSSSKQSQFSREREISEISAGVKSIAKDLCIPVILLAQLNRQVENRAGGNGKAARPRMSDLKDSGSIEADADVIGLLSRDAYQGGEDATGYAQLDIAKNRNGPTGTVNLTFIDSLVRFEQGSPRPESPYDQPQNRWEKS